jgi:hypothetical protein
MKHQKYPLRRLWLVVALFLAFLLMMQIPWGRNHRTNIGVSRSFAPNGDEIRTADGRVDYLATSNSLASRDLLPADNSAVDYVRLIGLEKLSSDPQFIGDYCALLGVDPKSVASTTPWTDAWSAFWKEQRLRSNPNAELPNSDYERMMNGKWSAKDFPYAAKVFDEMQPGFDSLRTATRKRGYFHPLVGSQIPNLNVAQPAMASALLPLTQELREFARKLAMDAMYQAGKGDSARALEDVFSIHRLSGQLSNGQCLMEGLVATAVAGIANTTAITLINEDTFDESQLADYAKFLEDNPVNIRSSQVVDRGERYMGLDTLQLMDRDGVSFSSMLALNSGNPTAGKPSTGPDWTIANRFVDWGAALEVVNLHCDELVQVLKAAEESQVHDDFGEFKSKLEGNGAYTIGGGVQAILSPSIRGRYLADFVLRQLVPAVEALNSSNSRSRAQRDALRLIVALERYRIQNQSLPKTLDALAPEFIAVIPLDRFTGQPFRYLLDDTGYSITSTGPDRQFGASATSTGNDDIEFRIDFQK